MDEIKIGQRFPLTIKRQDINGNGIGYYKRKITFVVGALPQEVVVAEVTAVHDRYLEAKTHRIKTPSPHRVKPIDPNWGKVGGVELGHMDYGAQLNFKRDVVSQSLAKYKPAGWQHYDLRATLGAKNPLHYRNKAQFQVRLIDGHVRAGLYAPNSHDLVPLSEFATQKPLTMQIINQLCGLLEQLEVPIYDEAHKSGIVKTLVVRENAAGQAQLTIVTNSAKLPHKNQLLEAIARDIPAVISVSQNINKGETAMVWGPKTELLAGAPYLMETIMGREFRLSPQAFLQLNPEQTERLYQQAINALDLKPHETLVDAYAGVGTIGLSLAHLAKEVRGMETIPEAVDDANANAKLNGIENAHYVLGKAEDVFPQWLADGFRADAVIVDPPRAGLDAGFIKALHRAKPKRFVYISCNPSTLARDLVQLTKDWRVDYIQSIDMFPQTARCEAVVKFSKR
ncbi:23S rRNA (uracil(1939)-C(5))-methyltransferase RlmD [Lacticaseibacillus manihotivorans]|jgi:23S rRNA (uracil-5-)-methyltransferase RumA|uniref:tRNA (Uracil-5-)-methyltransferase n=2 Tax=Lacticaseibacillus manihotivorans TaxID=88233 RepID=A0A0R1QLI6_9LACO|nr:23S rRNA (uracil(1939)-C(5))-methyltransferase RlmD [Lacticaseibacillus manihotivorans]KRL45369.1 tRNA (uracil-5-)-methyltransferase [Lacticaseibacillus manihotivorans DSM 13343 = JCM 12514]QFQ91673.1 23S rRNA (uracil(1939)-C(5))-methyltransferase RlmD [Lacticaseibacillus manihotivorans]